MSGRYPVILRPGRMPEPVPRDPFTIGAAIVTAVSSAAGTAALTYSAFVVTSYVVGTVAVGALLAGAQWALSKTLTDKADGFGGPANVAGINAPEMRQNLQQSTPIERIIYGRIICGGAITLLDDSVPPYLVMQTAISSRRLSAAHAVLIGINRAAFTDVHTDAILTPIPGDGVDYSNHLRVSLRAGDPDQEIDPLLAERFPSLDPEFRQRGIATATFEFNYGADRDDYEGKWGQVAVPNALVEVSGATVFDPRDPTQDPNDEATWKYRNTAALVQADWLRQEYGLNFPVSRIRWDKVAESANFDDELVATNDGGVIPRHTINGVVSFDQKPQDVAEAMLTANRGFIVQSRGIGFVSSSQPREPVLTIDDRLMLGSYEFRDDRPKKDVLNAISSQFSSSDREWNEAEGPHYRNEAYLAEDGEPLESAVRLPFTDDHRVVQRLQKQFVDESRLGRAWAGELKLRARRLEIGDCVRIWSRLFPRMNGLYTVEDLGFSADFSSIVASLAEYDPEISRRWIPQNDEQPFELPALEVA